MIKNGLVRSKTLIEWVSVCAFCVTLALVSTWNNWLWRFDMVLYDTVLDLRDTRPSSDIVIIAIDDRSLDEIGRWPWSRAIHAVMLERLRVLGAKVVAFDIIMNEVAHANSVADQVLASAMKAHGKVVLPITHAVRAGGQSSEAIPPPLFRDAAAALGHIHIEIDPDGIARTLYLWEGLHTPRYPQLALAALQLSDPVRAARYSVREMDYSTGGQGRHGGDQAHGQGDWRRAEWIHIPYSGPPGTYQHVSYVDVLRGNVTEAQIRDAIVFIGVTAVGLGDMVPSPTSGHAGLMPGVEIHATMFDALRRGVAVGMVPMWLAMLLNAAPVVILMLVMLRSRPQGALLAMFSTVAAQLLIVTGLMQAGWVWLPTAAGIVAAVLAYPLWSWRRLEAGRHYFELELEALRRAGGNLPPRKERQGSGLADRFVDRVEVLQQAVQQQRNLQLNREQTMHFLSHDLRAPLASIVTMLEEARQQLGCGACEKVAGGEDHLLMRIERHARFAMGMADNLLRLVRAETINSETFSEQSLEMLVQDAADEAWELAQSAEVKLSTTIAVNAEQECCVLGDADLLRRAILNLLTNAIKYTPAGGSVDLRLAADGPKGWVVEVIDTGAGIPEEQQQQLFRRFGRLDNEANRKISGIGLGLLMVRTVAERHGGKVTLESAPGIGSCFRLHLPAHQA